MEGSVLIPKKLKKVCIKRKYGKYPARYADITKLINKKTELKSIQFNPNPVGGYFKTYGVLVMPTPKGTTKIWDPFTNKVYGKSVLTPIRKSWWGIQLFRFRLWLAKKICKEVDIVEDEDE